MVLNSISLFRNERIHFSKRLGYLIILKWIGNINHFLIFCYWAPLNCAAAILRTWIEFLNKMKVVFNDYLFVLMAT